MNFKFPLATATWDQDEIDAMQNVINSGNFTMGKQVASFENGCSIHWKQICNV